MLCGVVKPIVLISGYKTYLYLHAHGTARRPFVRRCKISRGTFGRLLSERRLLFVDINRDHLFHVAFLSWVTEEQYRSTAKRLEFCEQ